MKLLFDYSSKVATLHWLITHTHTHTHAPISIGLQFSSPSSISVDSESQENLAANQIDT